MSEKPVLYLLPGLLCDRVVWQHQAAHLADLAEVRIASFYGFDLLSAMAMSVLADAPARFAVAGHSMGGRVSFEIMRVAAERVTHLALLDTGVVPAGEGEAAKRQELIDLAFNEGMTALAARWLPPMVHPEAPVRDPELMRTLTEMVCRASPEIYAGQVKALLHRPDFRPHLGEIRCPTLVGVGRQDGWSTVAQHEPIAAAVPGAELRIYEDSGHMVTMEAAEAVTASLREWLGRTA